MSRPERLCIYCGSRAGGDPAYAEAARAFGAELARRGIGMVNGGGRVGLMGVIADSVMTHGGEVIGIIPEHLQSSEVGHEGLSDLRIVSSMHERKAMMADLSDGFVVFPGGLGTMDETFEIVTWKQLGLHDKPIVIADIAGYWKPFADLVDHIIGNGFAAPENRNLFTIVDSVDAILPAIERAPAPTHPFERSRA